MEHKYFDVSAIYEDIERRDAFDMGDILTKYEDTGFSHRWIQPPVACYFVTTVDIYGNVNCAPISMGTAMWGEPSDCGWYYCFDVHNRRQTRKNLQLTKECVISYYPAELLAASNIAGLPLPIGISEIDVAKLTPLPSVKVKAPGIAECVSNVEVKILDSYPLSNNTLFIGRVVGCHVQKDLLERDMKIKDEPGLGGCDLLYEVSITGEPPRLNYARLDTSKRYRTDEKIGDNKRWIGNFISWMDSEKERGRISEAEYKELMDLNQKWNFNKDPKTNGEVKDRLTAMLRDICWRNVD